MRFYSVIPSASFERNTALVKSDCSICRTITVIIFGVPILFNFYGNQNAAHSIML